MSRYYSSNNEVAQVDKFVTGTDVIKKKNFSDNVKKSVSHLNAVKGLNHPFVRILSNFYRQLCERNESKIERPACYKIPTCSFYHNSW